MMKVLAAEMSDPGRLRRGKQLARDGSVLDIIIEPSLVTCEVQGSRATPYVTTIRVSKGDGMPLRRDVTTECACPDDDNWDGYACKHAVAAMFTLSDEFLLDPSLLDIWRSIDADQQHRDTDADEDRPEDDESEPARPDAPQEPSRQDDPLREQLTVPSGATLPTMPDLEFSELLFPKPPLLAATLRDALANLRIEWD